MGANKDFNIEGKNVPQEEKERQIEQGQNKDPYNVTDMRKLWKYKKLEDGTLRITDYKGDNPEIEIPPRIGKNRVSAIGDEAFTAALDWRGYPDFRRQRDFFVTIRSITIPEGVTSIGESAFSGCKSLTSITIPEGVTSLGSKAFEDCCALTSLMLPKSVTSIGDWAFSNCSALTSITIPESVTHIGDFAFSCCSSLKSIEIPDGVDNVATLGLHDCAKPADADGYVFIGHILVRYAGNASHVVIPDGVTGIDSHAFAKCSTLMSVAIPESVRGIGIDAFSNCSSLTKITIPERVASIARYTFFGCSALTSIIIPESITHIGDRAFDGCSALTSIAIPKTVTSIGECVFQNCSSLVRLVIPAGVQEVREEAFYGCSDSLQIIADIDSIKGSDLRRRVALTYLQEPNAFTFGQDHVIRYIKSQKKQLLPEIFKNDLDYAMTLLLREKAITKENIDADFLQPAIEANAVKCTAVLLNWKGENVTQDEEDRRFERELQKDLYNVGDMKKLWSYEKREDGTLCITSYKGEEKKIEVPPRIGKNPVTAICKDAFSANKSGRTYKRFEFLVEITDIHLPDSVMSIGDEAFSGCLSLTGIVIPDGVTSIGDGVFSGCSALTSITIPASVVKIGSSAFRNCPGLTIHAPEGSYAAEYAKEHGIPIITTAAEA